MRLCMPNATQHLIIKEGAVSRRSFRHCPPGGGSCCGDADALVDLVNVNGRQPNVTVLVKDDPPLKVVELLDDAEGKPTLVRMGVMNDALELNARVNRIPDQIDYRREL
jgi:hypothetical protein